MRDKPASAVPALLDADDGTAVVNDELRCHSPICPDQHEDVARVGIEDLSPRALVPTRGDTCAGSLLDRVYASVERPRMPLPRSLRLLVALLGCCFALTASAAENDFEATFRKSLLQSFDDASGKILALAEEIPEQDYGWRPMNGVSSVTEVLVHVTETNLFLGTMLGAPASTTLDAKTVGAAMKSKVAAIAMTKQGMDYIRNVIATVPAAELNAEMNIFGTKAPKLRAAMLPSDHAHEHLGQLIAYARSNQVVPPWSR